MKFFSVEDKGMGRGEMQALLALANAAPGGTARHDLVMSDGDWEVKEHSDQQKQVCHNKEIYFRKCEIFTQM